MSIDVKKRSGFVLRLIALVALSLALLFSALVVMENKELTKLVPFSPFRSLALFFSYTLAIMSFNYFSAIRGGNLMGWRVEVAVVLIAVVLFAAAFMPFAFPRELRVSGGFSGFSFFWRSEAESSPDWRFAWIAASTLPLVVYVVLKLRSMPLWQSES